MAERIEGRYGVATLISDTYGITVQTGLPDPPEKPKPTPRSLDRAAVVKKFGWTEADAARVIEGGAAYNFPVGRQRLGGGWSVSLIWREDEVDRWAAERREHAREILRLVGR